MADPADLQGRLVVIGGSAGAIRALEQLLSGLPSSFSVPVLVVVHLGRRPSELPSVLERAGPLPARFAEDGEALASGGVLVAPPNRHLLVEDGSLRVAYGPAENGHRPAVDPLFRSAAAAAGGRVVAVILSGSRGDGAAGLAAVKRAGGITVVQSDPLHGGMPSAAQAAVDVDHLVRADEMGRLLVRIGSEPVVASPPAYASGPPLSFDRPELEAMPATGLTCPTCGGALWESEADGGAFVCHIGHRFSDEALAEAHEAMVERALLAAVRVLEERAALLRRLERRISQSLRRRPAHDFLGRAAEAERHADTIRQTLTSTTQTTTEGGQPDPETHGAPEEPLPRRARP